MTISIAGFMGCGKSSVGKRLSELLCCRFMDLDKVIVEREGRSIPEIFASDGEEEFRRMEKEALESILATELPTKNAPTSILALGGGAVMTAECERMVHEESFCIYLRASVETLIERLTGEVSGRPLLSGADSGSPDTTAVTSGKPSVMSDDVEKSALRDRILELMRQRTETYERVAHIIVDTDGKSVAEIAEEIKERI